MSLVVRLLTFAIALCLALALLIREEDRGTFDQQNADWLNFLVNGAGGRISDPEVTFVRIDDPEGENFESWPPPMLDWAVILKSLVAAMESERSELSPDDEEVQPPEVIAIVPPLNWPDDDILARGALRNQALRMRELILGTVIGPSVAEDAQPVDPALFSALERVEGDIARLPEAEMVISISDEDLMVNGTPAFTHIDLSDAVETTSDGIRVPLLARVGDSVIPSLPLLVHMHQSGVEPGDVKVHLPPGKSWIRLGDEPRIPIDSAGRVTAWPGVLDEIHTVEASDLILASSNFAGEIEGIEMPPLHITEQHPVVVGYDLVSIRQFPLPGDEPSLLSRSHLLTMALATMRSGSYISLRSDGQRTMGWILIGLIGAIALFLRRSWAAVVALSLVLGWIFYSVASFRAGLVWSLPVPSLTLAVLAGGLALLLPRKKSHTVNRPGKVTTEKQPKASPSDEEKGTNTTEEEPVAKEKSTPDTETRDPKEKGPLREEKYPDPPAKSAPKSAQPQPTRKSVASKKTGTAKKKPASKKSSSKKKTAASRMSVNSRKSTSQKQPARETSQKKTSTKKTAASRKSSTSKTPSRRTGVRTASSSPRPTAKDSGEKSGDGKSSSDPSSSE